MVINHYATDLDNSITLNFKPVPVWAVCKKVVWHWNSSVKKWSMNRRKKMVLRKVLFINDFIEKSKKDQTFKVIKDIKF